MHPMMYITTVIDLQLRGCNNLHIPSKMSSLLAGFGICQTYGQTDDIGTIKNWWHGIELFTSSLRIMSLLYP